jgi:hypothetical protein
MLCLLFLASNSHATPPVPWWRRTFSDDQTIACTVWAQAERLAAGQVQPQQLLPQLHDTRKVFTERDGETNVSLTVRDLAITILAEADDRDRPLVPGTRVKLIACCLQRDETCNRIHVPNLSDTEIQQLIHRIQALPPPTQRSGHEPAAGK